MPEPGDGRPAHLETPDDWLTFRRSVVFPLLAWAGVLFMGLIFYSIAILPLLTRFIAPQLHPEMTGVYLALAATLFAVLYVLWSYRISDPRRASTIVIKSAFLAAVTVIMSIMGESSAGSFWWLPSGMWARDQARSLPLPFLDIELFVGIQVIGVAVIAGGPLWRDSSRLSWARRVGLLLGIGAWTPLCYIFHRWFLGDGDQMIYEKYETRFYVCMPLMLAAWLGGMGLIFRVVRGKPPATPGSEHSR